MATIISGNQLKLANGQTVTGQNGGWYDGEQLINGTLSNPGQINSQSSQQGAGKAVSQQVVAQTNPNNAAFVNSSRAQEGLTAAPNANNPTPVPTEQTINPNGFNAAAATPATSAVGSTGGLGGTTSSTGGSGLNLSGFGGSGTPALNLPGLYTSLSSQAGIPALQQQITDKTKSFNDAQSKINDNPYLSESDRTGQIQKLTTDFNNDIKTTQDSLAMAQQDIQTQIDLQTKQFDINSQQATQALSEFNTLLSSGALAGASGSDIAAITAATGISSSEIQAAISAQTQKDAPTAIQTVDDGKNQYAVVLNTKTGQVISKTVLAASPQVAPKTTVSTVDDGTTQYQVVTNSTTGQVISKTPLAASKPSTAATTTSNQQQYDNWAATDAKNGATLQQMVENYGVSGGLTVPQIYQIYNANTKNGQAKETLQQAEQGQFVTNSKPTSTAAPAFNLLDPSTW